ncbi:hypothetical protein Adt_03915 [Abeliophyllum distichum]|uniref:Uncharacterized protein n=1 Tax=Abeliophyllum distichum TaxID=126358 RepID=A0ABD1VZU6_9LAMI
MGAQAVKKYFTPKWEEFSSHGDLEDVLEASLASAIRASTMQMKVLSEFRTRIQEQRRLSAAASKSDKEQKQALEGLQAALDSAREKKEMEERLGSAEAKLENAEAEFVANFHNTEAYTNFSDYFARVGQQEVLAVLKNDYPNFDLGILEARFPPPDAGSEEDS